VSDTRFNAEAKGTMGYTQLLSCTSFPHLIAVRPGPR
jgi:hypothetical protein